MSRARFKPTPRALWVWSLATCLVFFCELMGLASASWPQWPLAELILAGTAAISMLDLLVSWSFANIRITRTLPHNLSLGKATKIQLSCEHQHARPIRLQLYDHLPLHFDSHSMPLDVTVPPGRELALRYQAIAKQRGEALFDGIDIQAYSLLGLWFLKRHNALCNKTKVFPNFTTIEGMKLIAVEHQTSQLGIRQKPRRGQGTDFHELRDYREGDTLRQIDWNATSRRHKLIARHYQEERDQNIILMLDSGQRMLSKEGNSTYFDHCLNGLLMLSYVALKQGDSISMVSFDQSLHWSAPVKGSGGITRLLQRFYDLYPQSTASDYLKAAQDVMDRGYKRSLVVMATNLREDDAEELIAATSLLQKKHMVILANLREATLNEVDEQEIENLDQALTYSGLSSYLEAREILLKKLRVMKVMAIDCAPAQLTSQLVSSYLAIKRAGQL